MLISTRREAFTTAVIVVTAMVALRWITINTIRVPQELHWNSWAFYEWLISYQGGFVRRGLGGELIARMSFGSEVEAVNWLVFLIGALYVVSSALIAFSIRRFGASALLYAFAPTGFFWAAASNEHYYRKEMLFYLAMFLVAALYGAWTTLRRRWIHWLILGLITLCAMTLPLIHEAYLFYCTLFFSLVIYSLVAERSGKPRARLMVQVFIAANLAIFALLCIFKGSVHERDAIWSSLSPAARAFARSATEAGGISGIGYSLSDTMRLCVAGLLSGVQTYYMFPLALVYLITGRLYSDTARIEWSRVYSNPTFVANFLLVCASFAPMLIVSWDLGRLIFGVFVVFSTMVLSGLLLPWTFAVDPRQALSGGHARAGLVGLLLLICLFTRAPECCLSGSGHGLGSVVKNLVYRLESTLERP